VSVSVRVLKTDNFITTSHFAFTWGGGFGPIQACPFVRPGLFGHLTHLTDFVKHLITFKHCLGMPEVE